MDEINKDNKDLFEQTLYNNLGIIKDEITKISLTVVLFHTTV